MEFQKQNTQQNIWISKKLSMSKWRILEKRFCVPYSSPSTITEIKIRWVQGIGYVAGFGGGGGGICRI
jgi:hypothetical protein